MKNYRITVTSETEKKHEDNCRPYGAEEFDTTIAAATPQAAIESALSLLGVRSATVSRWFDVDDPTVAASAVVDDQLDELTTKHYYLDACDVEA